MSRSMDLKKGAGKEALYSTTGESGLSWASKYQPRCGSDVLGNEEAIRDIKEWLTGWTRASAKSASGWNHYTLNLLLHLRICYSYRK